MAEIELAQVRKEYPGGVVALADFSLRIESGELLVLVGPSGCGKTTTLRLIAGLETLTAGTIRIDGADAAGLTPPQRDIALVFQRPALYPHLTVRDNLAFSARLRQRPGLLRRLSRIFSAAAARRRHAEEVLLAARLGQAAELLGLRDLLDRYPAQLSGGQQQRVALGRALVRRPRVILFDEPLAGLDAPLRLELRRELHLLHRGFPETMVYVTHDPVEAMALADRVAVLTGGAVQQVDRPDVLLARPANRFVAGFFSGAPVNFFDGELVLEGESLFFGTAGRKLPLPASKKGWAALAGRAVTLGLRAEDVSVPRREADGPGGWNLTMCVALVEPLGQGHLVSLTASAPATPLAKLHGCQKPAEESKMEEGQMVTVHCHLDRAHLFDRVSGAALGYSPADRFVP